MSSSIRLFSRMERCILSEVLYIVVEYFGILSLCYMVKSGAMCIIVYKRFYGCTSLSFFGKLCAGADISDNKGT